MSEQPTYDELTRKVADLELRNKELNKFKVAFQSADEGMALVDFEGKIVEANTALCAILGYDREELLQKYAGDFKPSRLLGEFRQHLDLIKKRGTFSTEVEYQHKDGSLIIGEITSTVIHLEGESMILVIARDITRRKQREEVLRRYEKIFSITKDLVAFVDEEYIYQMVNESYTRAHNKRCEEIVGQSVAEMIGDEVFLQTVKPNLDRCLSGETVRFQAWFEFSGGRRYRDVTYYPHRLTDNCVVGVFVIAHDLTELRLAQEAQQAKHNLLSHILDHTPNGVYVVNKTHDILYCNPALENEFGSVINRKCYEAIAEREAPCPWCQSDKVFSGESVQWEGRSVKTGNIYVRSESLLSNTEYGHAKVTFFMDVTQQRKVENDLRDHNELLLALINASPDIICFKDGLGRWLLANETDLQLFQLTGIDYKGKTDADLAQYTEFYRQAFRACMDSDEKTWAKGQLSVGEEVIPIPGGGHKIFEVVKVPLFQPDGSRKGLVVLGHDITDRMDTEEKLRLEIDARRQASQVLEQKSSEVADANIALRVLVSQQENAVKETQQNVLIQLEQAVFPYINLLRQSLRADQEIEYLDILTSHLRSVGSSFIKKLSNPDLGLTKKEILIADLVRQGKSTKEIAQLLGLQGRSVEAYRNKIRKKLHLNNKKIGLCSYLSSTFTADT